LGAASKAAASTSPATLLLLKALLVRCICCAHSKNEAQQKLLAEKQEAQSKIEAAKAAKGWAIFF